MTLDALYKDLQNPPLGTISLKDALELWHFTSFEITCQRPPLLEETPDLAARLRGGMGQALKHSSATSTRYSLQKHIHAFDLLFAPLVMNGRDEVPHPFIIQAEIMGDVLKIQLRLFGMAQFWADDTADALVTALENGIALKQDGHLRVPLQIIKIEKQKTSIITAKEPINYVKIQFKSPFCLRQNEKIAFSSEGVLRAVERRVHALMPWQGFKISEPFSKLKFKSIEKDLLTLKWVRHSLNQGSNPIPMQGFLGEFILEGDLTPLSPWLHLAQTANIGSHTSLGLGWFELIAV